MDGSVRASLTRPWPPCRQEARWEWPRIRRYNCGFPCPGVSISSCGRTPTTSTSSTAAGWRILAPCPRIGRSSLPGSSSATAARRRPGDRTARTRSCMPTASSGTWWRVSTRSGATPRARTRSWSWPRSASARRTWTARCTCRSTASSTARSASSSRRCARPIAARSGPSSWTSPTPSSANGSRRGWRARATGRSSPTRRGSGSCARSSRPTASSSSCTRATPGRSDSRSRAAPRSSRCSRRSWRGAAGRGVEQLTIGMPHRGRINFLANIMKKPLDNIFSEFESAFAPPDVQGHDDVKYHLGYSSDHVTPDGRRVRLSLYYNPSHLEFVNPVVLGAMRARQEMMADHARERGIPVLIHGDAAFSGEGIVPETLALSQLPAYESGGTIHVVVNNQVGFNPPPHDARTSRYPSAIMRVVDAPVLHVNGDDPEACVHAMTLALEYRMRFKRDVCIDLVCYRKHGHNELDDPTFTQPVMYKAIAAHVPAPRQYADKLVRSGVLDAGAVERMEKELEGTFRAAHRRASSEPVVPVRREPHGDRKSVVWGK